MHPHIPIHDLWWLAAGGASYGANYVRNKVRQHRRLARREKLPDPSGDLLRLQAKYGYNAHSLVSIAPGANAWMVPGLDGAIVYGEFGCVWLAAGDPIAKPEDIRALTEGFLDAARKAKRITAFVPATENFARQAKALNLTALKIGAAPYFDLQAWNPRGNSAKKMRAGVNQALRSAVRIELISELSEPIKREVADLSLDWLKSRPAATTFGWLLALDPFLHFESKKLFAARDKEDRMIGLLSVSPIPARNGWYLEDVLRAETAPPGTSDLLVVEILKHLKAEGATLATLGTTPLAKEGEDNLSTREHPVIELALRTMSRRFSVFYNFEGLKTFKSKFVPTWWESEYVLLQEGAMVSTHVAHAILRAVVPGGVKQILTRKALRSIKRSV
jgi:phosphatidylglycerol lysyltransferase